MAELLVPGHGDNGIGVGLIEEQSPGLEHRTSTLSFACPDGGCLSLRLPLQATLTAREVQCHHFVTHVREPRHGSSACGFGIARMTASNHDLELVREVTC